MPRKPQWYVQLGFILESLRSSSSLYVDRRTVERLFGVGPRRARQLMAGLPGIDVGNAAAVERAALVARLEAIQEGGEYVRETSRRERLATWLERSRSEWNARQVEVRVTGDVWSRRWRELPAAILVEPGRLEIRFSDAEELAALLMELSQAMANDWEEFRGAVEAPEDFPARGQDEEGRRQ